MLRSGLLPVTYAEVEKLLATVLGKKKTKIIDINLCLTKDNYTFGYFPFNRFSCQNSTLPLRAHLLYFSPKAPELDILAILLQKPLHTSTIQFPL